MANYFYRKIDTFRRTYFFENVVYFHIKYKEQKRFLMLTDAIFFQNISYDKRRVGNYSENDGLLKRRFHSVFHVHHPFREVNKEKWSTCRILRPVSLSGKFCSDPAARKSLVRYVTQHQVQAVEELVGAGIVRTSSHLQAVAPLIHPEEQCGDH